MKALNIVLGLVLVAGLEGATNTQEANCRHMWRSAHYWAFYFRDSEPPEEFMDVCKVCHAEDQCDYEDRAFYVFVDGHEFHHDDWDYEDFLDNRECIGRCINKAYQPLENLNSCRDVWLSDYKDSVGIDHAPDIFTDYCNSCRASYTCGHPDRWIWFEPTRYRTQLEEAYFANRNCVVACVNRQLDDNALSQAAGGYPNCRFIWYETYERERGLNGDGTAIPYIYTEACIGCHTLDKCGFAEVIYSSAENPEDYQHYECVVQCVDDHVDYNALSQAAAG